MRMYSWILYCLTLCQAAFLITCIDLDCISNDKCSCKFTDGRGIVDITSLGRTDNKPRFQDIHDTTNHVYYSYNPCGGFNEGECSDAASCLLTSDKSEQSQIGDAKEILFKYDTDKQNVVAAYTSGTGIIKLTQVNLICDENACEPTFMPLGQTLNSYDMKMTTVCACPGMCDQHGPISCKSSNNSVSMGVIVILVVFGLALVYMIGGTLYMKIKLKATGTDIILHKEFFKSIPGLIRAGFVFTFGKCLPRRFTETYEGK